MSVPAGEWISPEEYLEHERASETRHEYFNGEIFAMAGASEAHNLLCLDLARLLWHQLRGKPCRVYANNVRLKIAPTGLYTYPDVMVACGERRMDDDRTDTVLNPTVLIEVLSPSIEAYDREEKAAHYRRIESLREYVIVAQDRVRVERFARQEGTDTWEFAELSAPSAVLHLRSIGCELSLAEIYEDVELPESPVVPRPQVDPL